MQRQLVFLPRSQRSITDLASCDQPQRCSVAAHDVQPQSQFVDDAPKMPLRFTMVDMDSEVER